MFNKDKFIQDCINAASEGNEQLSVSIREEKIIFFGAKYIRPLK